MILFANAKINLGLSVFDRRDDGYHNIVSTFLPVPIHDIIEILPAKEFNFHNTGIAINPTENLIIKAFNLLKERCNIPNVYMHLHKCIPLGAGLGGGSSDAAFTLKGLNDLFKLNISQQLLMDLALELGSDCPFFIFNSPANIRGRGEIIQSTRGFEGNYCKVVFPDIHISTEDAFKNLIRHDNSHAFDLEFQNDFENWAFQQYPEIEKLKEKLYQEGAFVANMTGSGSAVFGIYKEKPQKTTGFEFERIFRLE